MGKTPRERNDHDTEVCDSERSESGRMALKAIPDQRSTHGGLRRKSERRNMTTKTFDPKCYDLAEAFLREEPRWLALLAKQQLGEVNDLAGRIQATIENFLEELE